MPQTTHTDPSSVSNLDTFPKLLLNHAELRGDNPAIREKDFGIWQFWTWQEMAEEIRALACGLAAKGFQRGDKLAIVGENRPPAILDHGGHAVSGRGASTFISRRCGR